MSSIYTYKPGGRFHHLSVGAVLFNEKLEICTHHFYAEQVPENVRFLTGNLSDGYLLMRETVEDGESIQDAVYRGLKEEFGAVGVIESYLGSLVCIVNTPTTNFEKTTLYHAVRLVSLGERTGTDEESTFTMEWHAPQDLLVLYHKQAQMTNRQELDETKVIERFMEMYKSL